MRQIILDTETTGLLTEEGNRIIEIGAIELVDRKLTGKKFHHYINPNREVERGALAVHGITNEFLIDKPLFGEIFVDFLDFFRGAEVIAHNAPFDIGFITHEIKLLKQNPKILTDHITVFDTLVLARKMFPGQRNNLDALCKRFKIDLSERNLHGGLLDAHLLAKVYLAMTGGQTTLFAEDEEDSDYHVSHKPIAITSSTRSIPIIYASHEELAEHERMMDKIMKK